MSVPTEVHEITVQSQCAPPFAFPFTPEPLLRVLQFSAWHRNVSCQSNVKGIKQRRAFCLRYFMLISQLEVFHVSICLDLRVICGLLWFVSWTEYCLSLHHLCTSILRYKTLKFCVIIVLKHEAVSKLDIKPITPRGQPAAFNVVRINIKILWLFSKSPIPAVKLTQQVYGKLS
jgi:hypothetical protein